VTGCAVQLMISANNNNNAEQSLSPDCMTDNKQTMHAPV